MSASPYWEMSLSWRLQKMLCECVSEYIERVMNKMSSWGSSQKSYEWSMWHFKCLIFTGKESSAGVQDGTFIMLIDVLASVEKNCIKVKELCTYVFSPLASNDRAVMLLIQMSCPCIPMCRRPQCPRL